MLRRKNKVFKTELMIAIITIAVVATVTESIYLANGFNKKSGLNTIQCNGNHETHKVIIQNDKVKSGNTIGSLCDSLMIINLDGKARLVAFGLHEDHQAYDGVTERLLTKGQSLSVTLVQVGNFSFHDHTEDQVQGTFSVVNQ